MRTLFFIVVLANVLTYGLGAGWFGLKPGESRLGAAVKTPTEFRPGAIEVGPIR
ncbi:MAG: hypothetical protein ACREXO_10205 [Advenella sp.]|jgi:hypothetical protein|uniref:Uncharacterized protein n=1 Tax=Advenella incenata TaxID=267800 RepID=A0A4Q7VRF7_9BURK|nr:hypothetical protein [Advenella incenata]RZT99093.1 hypothetical protein EV681_0875 [Advenella incenata]